MTRSTFFFYDLETSGIDPRRQRIMQFAGQRTDMDFNPVGEPINLLVSLTEDVLPDPMAILITGITPQKTREEGYTEAQFLRLLHEQVFTPGTIILGFNSVRFDDEFMRYTLYRNFYDPYEWQWKESRSRWDLLDMVRMTRALRPEGITWPVDAAGQPTNRLELLTARNGLEHESAHDALSDVMASIAVARLIKTKQPKLFEYLLTMRDKKEVAKLINLDDPQPFIYTSGSYPKEVLHTSVAFPIAPGGTPGSTIVYDLRQDPTPWLGKTVKDLKDCRFATREQRKNQDFISLPAKELAYNRCPAIAPLGVLDQTTQDRLQVDLQTVQRHLSILRQSDLGDKLREVFSRDGFKKINDVDAQLYDGFFNESDKGRMSVVRAADERNLSDFRPDFADPRLEGLLLRYKARNFPRSMNQDERDTWEAYRTERLNGDGPRFIKELQSLASAMVDDKKEFLVQELRLWMESILPAND